MPIQYGNYLSVDQNYDRNLAYEEGLHIPIHISPPSWLLVLLTVCVIFFAVPLLGWGSLSGHQSGEKCLPYLSRRSFLLFVSVLGPYSRESRPPLNTDRTGHGRCAVPSGNSEHGGRQNPRCR
jgi:hypothetical protein